MNGWTKELGALALVLFAAVVASGGSFTRANEASQFPDETTFSTLTTTPLAIEGLTGDDDGNLYTVGRAGVAGSPCLVWRIDPSNPSPVEVGFVPAPTPTSMCSPSGLAFNAAGDLFVADGNSVFVLTPSDVAPPTATIYASGVPGTNGLAFDRNGSLWTADGTTGLGRVWKVTTDGVVTEVFRIQPMRNGTMLGGTVPGDGIGRQVRTFPPGTLTPPPPNTLGGQDLVANGVAFDRAGDLFVADTARGAIWKVEFDRHGNLESRTGCDTTFTANTLCLAAIHVAHPLLEGVDGIALDRAGNIWAAANERNAIVVATRQGEVIEVFRNSPDEVTLRRNTGPLETPTSPFLSDRRFCTANSDGNRRDNSPSSEGEIGGPGQDRGKISCMDQELHIPGLPLPVR